jgi:hypothetical protein
MNAYVIINGKKYRTNHKNWRYTPDVPRSERILLDGALDVTYGPASIKRWAGEVVAPVTPDDATWGSVVDLRAALALRQKLTFIDHYGASRPSSFSGPFEERSLSPNWDGPSNTIYVQVKVMAI